MREDHQGFATPSVTGSASARQAVLTEALSALGLIGPRPVLVLVGGASNIAPAVMEALRALFERLAPLLDALGVILVDGGTAFGVMAAMGQARHRASARFPLLGVAARGTVALASLPPQAQARVLPDGRADLSAGDGEGARLDPNHSHFLLVPGERWGDESDWIVAAADCLAAGRPSLTLVAAGGRITLLDVTLALKAGRRLVVLAGTGGTADLLADWWRDGGEIPDLPREMLEQARIDVVDMAVAAERLPEILTRVLAS